MLIQAIAIIVAAIILTLLGLKVGAYRHDPVVRQETKRKVIQIFVGLIAISVAVTLVNYLVNGHMDPFACA